MKVLACKITDKEWREFEEIIGEESVSSVLRRWVRAYIEKKGLPMGLPIKEVRGLPIKSEIKIPGLKMQGNVIVGVDKGTPETMSLADKLPICNEYNFRKFKVGERVLVRRGNRYVQTVIPELDAEGNPM